MHLSRDLKSRLMNEALKFLEGAMRILPRWFIDLFMGALFPLVWLTTEELSQICQRNLELVFGPSNDKRKYGLLARRCLKSIGWAMMDVLYYVQRPDKLLKITTLEGEDHLKKALDLGRGVIVVSGHFGNFPLMFISLVQKGYKVNVVIRCMRDENFSKFMHQLCERWGIRMIQTTPRRQFLRESMEALRQNELLFFLLDEAVPDQKGIKVAFLKREVIRATGPVLFAQRTSSPIVPMFIAQDEKKHFKIFIEHEIEISKSGDPANNVKKVIMGLNNILEYFVYRYPFQWGGWFNKRWAFANEIARPAVEKIKDKKQGTQMELCLK